MQRISADIASIPATYTVTAPLSEKKAAREERPLRARVEIREVDRSKSGASVEQVVEADFQLLDVAAAGGENVADKEGSADRNHSCESTEVTPGRLLSH